MSCKKWGQVSIRLIDLRDLTAIMLSGVCKDIEIELKETPLTGKELDNRTINITIEARSDVKGNSICKRGQQEFFDLRVFDPSASHYFNKPLHQCYLMNKQVKKKICND